MTANGNVFWGYSISGSDEYGASILPTLAAVHNFPEQMQANARLIAAAPDLLEALTDIMREYRHIMGDETAEITAAFAAIAKAEQS